MIKVAACEITSDKQEYMELVSFAPLQNDLVMWINVVLFPTDWFICFQSLNVRDSKQ